MLKPTNGSRHLLMSTESQEHNFLCFFSVGASLKPSGSYSLQSSHPSDDEQFSLKYVWNNFSGYFIFLHQEPNDLKGLEDKLQNKFGEPPVKHALVWATYDEFNQELEVEEMINIQSEKGIKEGLVLNHGTIQTLLKSGKVDLEEQISLDRNDGSILLLSDVVHIAHPTAPLISTSQIQVLNNTYIPFAGEKRGAIISDAAILGDLNGQSGVPAYLTYSFPDQNNPGQDQSQQFPVGNIGAEAGSAVFHFSWDPLYPLDRARTFLAFTGQKAKLRSNQITIETAENATDSFFRTIYGEPIGLIPIINSTNTAKFVLQKVTSANENETDYQLAPAGSFEMVVQPGISGITGATGHLDPSWPQFMVCGLAGTEYIRFQSRSELFRGNALNFIPDQPAYAQNFPSLGETEQDGPLLTNKQTTSWVEVSSPVYNIIGPEGPTYSPPLPQYYAQPEENALFSVNNFRKGTTGANILDFYAAPTSFLQQSAQEIFNFPMVPYAGLSDDEINAYLKEDNHNLTDFEHQVLGPSRIGSIQITRPETSIHYGITATSPKGLFVEVNDKSGHWKKMVLAKNYEPSGPTGYSLEFDNLTSPLQSAFQSNQQFLVVSKNTDLGKLVEGPKGGINYPYFSNQIGFEGWLFDIQVPTALAPGDVIDNVMIFKYAKGTLIDWVKNALLWSNAASFTQDGPALAQALTEFVQAGIDAAKTDPNYQHFAQIAQDPNWMGILGLNVNVVTDTFPSQLQGLIAGIDLSKFKAHHLGININQPELLNKMEIGFPKKYTSSMFALIDYTDTRYQTPDQPVDLEVSASKPFAYAVLQMKVLFENSKIKDFQSKIQLSMDQLFYSEVTKTTVNNANPAGGDYKAILFDGYFTDYGGQPTYTFTQQTVEGIGGDQEFQRTKFFLNNNILNYAEISNGNFATLQGVTGPASAQMVESQFSLYANLTFNPLLEDDPAWDLFSFGGPTATIDTDYGQGLSISHLNIGMKFPMSNASPTGTTFSFNTETVVAEQSTSVARTESFFNNFPLSISSFISGKPGQKPVDLGYPSLLLQDTGINFLSVGAHYWYGLVFDLNLGTQGALSNGALFNSQMMIAWGADSADPDTYVAEVGFSLPGANEGSFRLENVLEFFTMSQALALAKTEESNKVAYQLTLQHSLFKLFGFSFPNYGVESADINFALSLFTNPDGNSNSLAWYGRLAQENIEYPIMTLSFLALGQRLALGSEAGDDVEGVIDAMKLDFVSPDYKSNKNNFSVSESKKWLIGTAFTLEDLVEVQAVFSDPNVYGILVSIDKDRKSAFAGLAFEILYRKVSETVGLFHTTLTLPKKYRNFELTSSKKDSGGKAVPYEITLPVLKVDWYTDGSFKIDLGFPSKITDFSDSFTVKLKPYVGSGGLYFGYLHAGASTETPQTTKGVFDPVLELGLGFSFGIAKEFKKKNLLKIQAGLSLVGIVEGVYAFYKPFANNSGKGATYFKVSGTVGLVGKLSAKLDLKLVKAALDLTVTATIAFILESYKAIPITLEATFKVKLKVEINAGFAKITVKLDYHTKAKLSFTVGFDELHKAPWYDGGSVNAERAMLGHGLWHSSRKVATPYLPIYRLDSPQQVVFNWNPIYPPEILPIQLYIVPHLTALTNNEGSQVANYIAMLYIKTSTFNDYGQEKSSGTFKYLAKNTLAWIINAYVNQSNWDDLMNSPISVQELSNINYTLTNSQDSQIAYSDIMAMLGAAFNVNIDSGHANVGRTFAASVFPMFPEMNFKAGSHLSVPSVQVNYDTFSKANETYVDFVNQYFEKLFVDYQSEIEQQQSSEEAPDIPSTRIEDTDISMVQFAFQDYFQMIGQAGLGEAIDYLQTYPYATYSPTKGPASLAGISSSLNQITTPPFSSPTGLGPTGNAITPGMIAKANPTVKLNPYATLLVGGYQIPALKETTWTEVSNQFGVSPSALGMANAGIPSVVKAGTSISINGSSPYTVVDNDTLASIAKGINGATPVGPTGPVNAGDVVTAVVNERVHTNPYLNIPLINYNPVSASSLQEVANLYMSTGSGGPSGPTGNQSHHLEAPLSDVIRLVEANQVTPGVVLDGTVFKPPTFGTTFIVQGSTYTFNYIAEGLGVTLPKLTQEIRRERILNSQASFAVPSMLLNNKGNIGDLPFTNFEEFSSAYNVDIPYLAQFNENTLGIFPPGQTLTIPNVVALKVEDILDGIFGNPTYLNSAGMAAQFFLQGLRLPVTNGITFGPPYEDVTIAPFYEMLGQQFGATSPQGPVKQIALEKNNEEAYPWLTFGSGSSFSQKGLGITLTKDQVALSEDIKRITLDPKGATYYNMPLAMDSPRSYQLKNHTAWAYPGKFQFGTSGSNNQVNQQPEVWYLSDPLLELIQSLEGDELALTPQKSISSYPNGQISNRKLANYSWGTFLNVQLRKTEQVDSNSATLSYSYELIGADESSIVYLERLIKAINVGQQTHWGNNAYILYQQGTDSGSGLQSEALGDSKTFVVQANLSTYTNPSTSSADLQLNRKQNLIGDFTNFVTLLWEASIVRSGGFYLYYKELASQNGLPDELFDDGLTAEISIVLTYNMEDHQVQNFVNCLLVGDSYDPSTDSIFIEDSNLVSKTAVVPPGNIGFEARRAFPESDGNLLVHPKTLLEQNYGLLGYQIVSSEGFTGSVEGLPASPGAPTGTTQLQKYQRVIPISKYVDGISENQLNPLGGGLTGPTGMNNPYLGVGSTATINLAWVDLFGNKIQFKDGINVNPVDQVQLRQRLGYTDLLLAISRYPSLSYDYDIKGTPSQTTLNINFSFAYDQYIADTNVPEQQLNVQSKASIDIETYTIACYQLSDILYRLEQEETGSNIIIKTSLEIDNGIPKNIPLSVNQFKAFLNYITEIYWFLYQVRDYNNYSQPPIIPGQIKDGNYTLSLETQLNNPDNIFELKTEFTIQRDSSFLNPEFAVEGLNPITVVTSQVYPVTSKSESSGYNSLTEFAQQFETAFETSNTILKVAQGIDRLDVEGNTANNKKVWAVRFGDQGISLNVGSTGIYYAPAPLANSPVYVQGYIQNYETGIGLTGGATKYYPVVNMDKWAREFTDALDNFLTAEYSIPTSLGSTLAYRSALLAKSSIVDSVANNVTPIVGPTGPSPQLTAAQERFKQNIAQKLSNIYSVDTIIQNPINVEYGTGPVGYIRLYGQPEVNTESPNLGGNPRNEILKINDRISRIEEDQAPGYSISTAKVPIDKETSSSQLTYLFSSQDKVDYKNMALDLNYNLTHIEHQIGDIPGITGYQPSSWLSFVLPIDGTTTTPGIQSEIGKLTIPIPLREYPSPPSIRQQYYSGATVESGPQGIFPTPASTGITGDGLLLQQAKYWSYYWQYSEVQAAQDSIQTNAQYSGATGSAHSNIPSGYTLGRELAQFIETYPAIQDDLNQYLTKVDYAQNDQSGTTIYNNAFAAVNAFTTIATKVANAWKIWEESVQVNALEPNPNIPNSNVYSIEETGSTNGGTGGDLVVTVIGNNANQNPEVPIVVYIPNNEGFEPVLQADLSSDQTFVYKYYREDSTPHYIHFADRKKYPFRTCNAQNLDIVNQQAGWGGVSIVRNQHLLEDEATNAGFIYQTPMVRLSNPLLPFVTSDQLINIAKIASPDPTTTTLLKHLYNLFEVLFKGLPQIETKFEQQIQVECVYTYKLQEDLSLETISLPVFLTVQCAMPTQTTPRNNTLINDMAQITTNWMEKRGLDQNSPFGDLQHYDGKLLFKITLFSNDQMRLPEFEVSNLYLEVNNIS